MSSGLIGKPHRIIFSSKNYVSGLDDIKIFVLKPNMSIHQVGFMSEFQETGFEGIYYFDIITSDLDPDGEYSIAIESASQAYKAESKASLLRGFGGGIIGENNGDVLSAKINLQETKAVLIKNNLSSFVTSSIISIDILKNINVLATIINEKITGKIKEV